MSQGAIEVLERLHEAISAIADVDFDTLGDGALDELVVGLQRARHRLAGVAAAPLTRWEAVGVWRCDGSRSATTRLARDCSSRRPPPTSTCAEPASCATCRPSRLRSPPGGCRWITSPCSGEPTKPTAMTCSTATRRCSSKRAPHCATPKRFAPSSTGCSWPTVRRARAPSIRRLRRPAWTHRPRSRAVRPGATSPPATATSTTSWPSPRVGSRASSTAARTTVTPPSTTTAPPHPERPVTVFDEIRVHLRWRCLHGDDDDGGDADEPAA